MSYDGVTWPECAECGNADYTCPDGLCLDCCEAAGHDHPEHGGMWSA